MELKRSIRARAARLVAMFAMALVCALALAPSAYADGAVARVGETEYNTFDGAVAAAKNGETVTLLANCSTSKGLSVTGKTLTVSGKNVSPKPVLTFEDFGMYLENSTVTFADCTVDMSNLMDNPTSSGGTTNLISGSALTFSNANLTLTMNPAAGGKSGIYLYGDHSELSIVNGSVANVSGFNQGTASGIYADDSEYVDKTLFKINVAGGSELSVSDCAWNGMTINPTDFTIDGGSAVTITDCGGDGTGKGGLGCYYGKTSVTNGSTLSVNDNGGKSWGIFTKDFEVDGTSKVEAKGNYGDGLTIGGKGAIADGATVKLVDNGRSGLRVYANAGYWTSDVTVAAGADVTITGNKASGIYNRGTLVMNAGQVTNNSAMNGGGINAVKGSSAVIGDGVVLSNNHAALAGDDLCAEQGAKISFGKTVEGDTLTAFNGCGDAITGWFDDSKDARWCAHWTDNIPWHVDAVEAGSYEAPVALKAAHGVTAAHAEISGTKVLKGADLAEGDFEFTLSQNDDVISRAKNAADGSFTFGESAFDVTADDIMDTDNHKVSYTLDVAEVKGNKANVTYDTSVKKVVVTAVPEDDHVKLTYQVDGKDVEDLASALVFTNTYTKPAEPTTPSEPKKPGKTTKQGLPKTGDASLAAPVAFALAAAAVCGAGVVMRRRG